MKSMDYDKGPQLTVASLMLYLACIPDDVKVCVGIGDNIAPAHYLINKDGVLVIHPDCYMQNASEMNLKTVLTLNKAHE